MKTEIPNLEARLEEYKALRSEILHWQIQRLRILFLLITVIGAILSLFSGFILKSPKEFPDQSVKFSIVGAISLYIILILLEVLLATSQRTIRRLGEYIRIYVESEIPGLGYETFLRENRKGASKRGAVRSIGIVCIGLSFAPLILPILSVIKSQIGWQWYFIILPFLLISLYFAFDLRFAFSSGFKSIELLEKVSTDKEG